MYIANNLIREVLDVGQNAAKRSKSISAEDIWNEFSSIDFESIQSLLQEIINANFGVAIPISEPPGFRKLSKESFLPVVGIDGSQVYPRIDFLQFGYVAAVAYPLHGKPLYRSDFVDIIALKNREIERPDLLQLLKISDGPTTFIDLWRSINELNVLYDAAKEYPSTLLLIDGPLLPPKTGQKENVVLVNRWAYWLQAIRPLQCLTAGIISGPSSNLIQSAVVLNRHGNVWQARQSRVRVTDREVMRCALKVGERSALFRFVNRRDSQLRAQGLGIYYFFLKTEKNEIVRVEVPEWVSLNPVAIDAIQSTVMEDSQPLGGYSFVLTAAHSNIAIPPSISNDLHSRAFTAYLGGGGNFVIPAKQWMKLTRKNG